MTTPRQTQDSTPSEDPNTGPRKTLAKNAENVMFYHLRGVSAPRTSMDFKPYYIYDDTRVLGSISKASRCVWVFFFLFVCFVFVFVLFSFFAMYRLSDTAFEVIDIKKYINIVSYLFKASSTQ